MRIQIDNRSRRMSVCMLLVISNMSIQRELRLTSAAWQQSQRNIHHETAAE